MLYKVNILYGKLAIRSQPTFVKVKVGKRKYTTESGTDPEKPIYETELIIELTSEDSKIEFQLRESSNFTRWGGGKLGNSRKVSLKELCLSKNILNEIKIYKKHQITGSIFVKIIPFLYLCGDNSGRSCKLNMNLKPNKPKKETVLNHQSTSEGLKFKAAITGGFQRNNDAKEHGVSTNNDSSPFGNKDTLNAQKNKKSFWGKFKCFFKQKNKNKKPNAEETEKHCSDSYYRKELFYAVTENQLDLTKYLLENGADPNAKCDNKQETVLHCAVRKGNYDICQLLVLSGADINELDSDCRTALSYAVTENQRDLARYLLEKGANPNKGSGKPLLHYAVKTGNYEICQLLVSNGSSIDAKDKKERTALFYAVTRNQTDLARYLLENRADPNAKCDNKQERVLHWAVRKGNYDMCQLLVLNSADIDKLDSDNRTALSYAVTENQIDLVRYLLENRANPNAIYRRSKDTVLHFAAIRGNLKICQLLVSKGACIDTLDSYDRTALSYAVEKNQLDLTKYLLKNGADPNVKVGDIQNTVLHRAVWEGNYEICQLLVSEGASINVLDRFNRTALLDAVTRNETDLARYLLDNGANPNEEFTRKTGAFDYDYEGDFEGDHDNEGDYERDTPLHCAVRKGNYEMCQLLVSNGAYIDALDSNQRTALYYAVSESQLLLTRYLLENGANPNAKCNVWQGKYFIQESMIRIAARKGNLDIFQLLFSMGANINFFTLNSEEALLIALENIISSTNHCPSNSVIAEYFLKNKIFYNSKLTKDIKDKYKEVFKQVVSSKHDFQKLEPISKWYPTMCKLTSVESDHSLKSICRDIIWEKIDNAKITDITNAFNIPECLRRYLIYAEELSFFFKDQRSMSRYV
jgi:ankyrin repeat protein